MMLSALWRTLDERAWRGRIMVRPEAGRNRTLLVGAHRARRQDGDRSRLSGGTRPRTVGSKPPGAGSVGFV